MRNVRSVLPGSWTEAAKSAGCFSHLYVIQEGDEGPCKIGIARNAFWRRSDLQTGNWRSLHLKSVFEADDRRAAVIAEAAVLSHFRAEHLSGEWLNVTPEALAEFIEKEFGNGAD